MKILMIEDDIGTIIMLRYKLDKTGVSVEAVETLKEAFKILAIKKFDIISLDLNLETEKLAHTIPAIKKLSEYAPVIVVSGHSDLATRKTCMEQGAIDFLSKNDLNTESIINTLKMSHYLLQAKE